MNGRPLTMAEAWQVCDRFFGDDRVAPFPEGRRLPRASVAGKIGEHCYLFAGREGCDVFSPEYNVLRCNT